MDLLLGEARKEVAFAMSSDIVSLHKAVALMTSFICFSVRCMRVIGESTTPGRTALISIFLLPKSIADDLNNL